MKYLFSFKKIRPGAEFKNLILSKLKKLEKFLHGSGEKEESALKIEIEKTSEVEPKKGLFKVEMHYWPIGHKDIHITSTHRNLKTAFFKAYKDLKTNLLKLHQKFHKKFK